MQALTGEDLVTSGPEFQGRVGAKRMLCSAGSMWLRAVLQVALVVLR